MANLPTTEIKGSETEIPGLIVFELNLIGDERGWLQEKYQKEKLVAAGLPSDFTPVQFSLAYNEKPGVTRGLHAEPWRKYVGVISGRAFGAYIDLRKGPTLGKKVYLDITPTTTVIVPKGVANSFQSLEANTYYSYLLDDVWSEKRMPEYKFVNLADPELNIAWPIPLNQAIMSERDKLHPMFKEVKPFDL